MAWDIEKIHKLIGETYEREKMSASWSNEKDIVKKALAKIESRLPQRYTPKSVLGVGGSGIVIRLTDSLFPSVDVALKFPRPVEGKVILIAEMLSKEIASLADLQHPGVVKISFYTTVKEVEGYGALPFYIMDAVDGAPSRAFARDPKTTEREFLALIAGTAEVIHYLHTHSQEPHVHLDIKPENVVWARRGCPVLIDLGTCKRVKSDRAGTTVACTRSFAHPELSRQLAKDPSDDKRAKGQLPRSDIDPRWDLWAFGLSILSWLGLDPADGSVDQKGMMDRLSPYTRKYLILLAARLLTDALPTWLTSKIGLSPEFLKAFPISTADELLETIRRIDGNNSPIDAVPELATATTGTIQAAPSLHVSNTKRLQQTLSHRLVRRLSSVTQLGLVSQLYPGAKHARREHSMGTYGNCRRIIRALYDDPVSPLFRQIITAQDIRNVLLCALLHDIGQFPLAHDLEDVDKKLFDHEELTQAMIKGIWAKKKKGSKPIEFSPLNEILKLWQSSPEMLLAVLNAKPSNTSATPRDKLLRAIISGPIDADKLDYLFRDARHTDVPYPNGVDTDRLYRCLTTVVIDKAEGGVRNVPAIGVHAKGKVAAEFLTLARYAMFSQVYWHHAVRAQKAMLFRATAALLNYHASSEAKLADMQARFIEMVCALPEALFENLPPTLIHTEDGKKENDVSAALGRGTDLVVTDAAVLSWLHDRLIEAKLPEAGLIDGILVRTWYKRLWVVSHDMQEKKWEKLVQAWDQLDRPKRHVVSYEYEKLIAKKMSGAATNITNMSASSAQEKLEQMTAAREPWLLIDIPGGRPGSETGLYYVLESQGRRLRKDDRSVGDLQPSLVWQQYAKDLRKVAGKIRIFCHPDFIDMIDTSIQWDYGIDELTSLLERLAP